MNLRFLAEGLDLWNYLKTANKKIVMYGMGNGADKILNVCEGYGIEIADFFASDGFVRGHSFHGKRVLSYSEAKEKYGVENIIVLLSFASSLPDVMGNIKKIASECELYAPDVPVCGGDIFSIEFARANKAKLEAVYNALADGESRRIFKNTVYYKLTGIIDFLFDAESDKDEVYKSLLCAEAVEAYADLGAYNGDTVRELLTYSESLKLVYALEPAKKTFEKLKVYAESESRTEIIPVNAAAWSHNTSLSFSDEGNRNSGLFAKGKQITVGALALDEILNGRRVDYIKYDVEGCEREALEGSRRTIASHHPRLLISAYHRSEDIFSLPLYIMSSYPEYKLYYRRYPYIPAWDLNLICI